MHEPIRPALAQLQAWFLTAMTAPGGAARGMDLAQQRYGLAQGEVLKDAGHRPARLHIYAEGYVQRLLECLQADFPVLRRTMGEELFDFFARAYVWRHPSRSPTLYDLGGGFADFLAASQPPGSAGLLQFPIELARLERARSEAGRAPGLEKQIRPARHEIGWLLGEEQGITLAPCTRLLVLSFPVQAYWRAAQAAQEGELPPLPAPGKSCLAIARLHYRLSMHSLLPWQFHFLLAAREQPAAALHHCAALAADACKLPRNEVLADALLWLPLAAAAGMLAGTA